MTSTRTQAWHQGAAEAASLAIAYVRPGCVGQFERGQKSLNPSLDSKPPGS